MNSKNPHIRIQPIFTWLFLFIFIAVFSFGCTRNNATQENNTASLSDFNKKHYELFAPYVTGNAEQARQSLKQVIQHLKESNVLDPREQALCLYIEYARLYVLERRTKNEAAAQVAFKVTQSWRIRSMRLANALDDDMVVFVLSETPERYVKYVNNLDAGFKQETGYRGNVPQYLQYITNALSEDDTNSL